MLCLLYNYCDVTLLYVYCDVTFLRDYCDVTLLFDYGDVTVRILDVYVVMAIRSSFMLSGLFYWHL